MKSVSGKELARVLERHGWQLIRMHGSHHIFGKTGSIVRPSVPIHGNTLEELKSIVQDAVRCHFEPQSAPRPIRLHLVKDEDIPA
jgi:predicted RNA binding protein YcfA (HicA-like mRNA interferase family)